MKDKNKLGLVVLFAGILVTTVWFITSNQFVVSNEQFGIYLLENDELVISDKDIISYNRTSHEIKLNQEGIAKIRTLDLCRKPFVMRLNGRTIYSGSFWSDIFSFPYSGIVITDILAVQHGSTDTIRIEPCYPPQFCECVDPRNNHELFNYFERVGKLIR